MKRDGLARKHRRVGRRQRRQSATNYALLLGAAAIGTASKLRYHSLPLREFVPRKGGDHIESLLETLSEPSEFDGLGR